MTFSVELPLTDATGASPDSSAAWVDCEGPRLTSSTSRPLRANSPPSWAAITAAWIALALANPTRTASRGCVGAAGAAALSAGRAALLASPPAGALDAPGALPASPRGPLQASVTASVARNNKPLRNPFGTRCIQQHLVRRL